MSPHNLQLKIDTVIINLNQPKVCNVTRLAVKKLTNNVIKATIYDHRKVRACANSKNTTNSD